MDLLPSATSLARALLTLGRAGLTGQLEVRASRRSARLAVVEGTPRAIALEPADRETLGDILAREGELDPAAHARALQDGTPSAPVGDWLVASGAASRPAVEWALRRQLESRIGHLFEWTGVDLRFRAGSADVGAAHVAEPVGTGDLVLGAMRSLVADTPLVLARRRLGDGVVVLSRLGESLLAEAKLWPEEAAMLPLLRRGAAVEAVLSAAAGSRRAILGLYALRLLSAARPPSREDRAYGVLLRKHRQLRHAVGVDDMRLLDLPTNARPEEARRALRRLAQLVHPDRFTDDEPAAVRDASREIMTALLHAERRVTSSRHR